MFCNQDIIDNLLSFLIKGCDYIYAMRYRVNRDFSTSIFNYPHMLRMIVRGRDWRLPLPFPSASAELILHQCPGSILEYMMVLSRRVTVHPPGYKLTGELISGSLLDRVLVIGCRDVAVPHGRIVKSRNIASSDISTIVTGSCGDGSGVISMSLDTLLDGDFPDLEDMELMRSTPDLRLPESIKTLKIYVCSNLRRSITHDLRFLTTLTMTGVNKDTLSFLKENIVTPALEYLSLTVVCEHSEPIEWLEKVPHIRLEGMMLSDTVMGKAAPLSLDLSLTNFGKKYLGGEARFLIFGDKGMKYRIGGKISSGMPKKFYPWIDCVRHHTE